MVGKEQEVMSHDQFLEDSREMHIPPPPPTPRQGRGAIDSVEAHPPTLQRAHQLPHGALLQRAGWVRREAVGTGDYLADRKLPEDRHQVPLANPPSQDGVPHLAQGRSSKIFAELTSERKRIPESLP